MQRKIIRLSALAIGIGVANAAALWLFEWAVNHGTHWLWDDVFHTNVHRWGVVPLAVGLGMLLSALFIVLKQKRVVNPETDLMKEKPTGRPTLRSVGIGLLLGLGSLLAGASLGPEAPLMIFAAAIAVWVAFTFKADSAADLLKLASIGALLVAFFGSMIPILIPFLELLKAKRLKLETAVPVLLAGGSSYGTLWLIDHKAEGFGTIPAGNHFALHDFILVVVLGFAAAWVGWSLEKAIVQAFRWTKQWDKKLHWLVVSALFGLVVGLLYWIGGESVQFSGNKGTGLLLAHKPAYGLEALIIILFAKLLVTGWSKASGYFGGLVFPSIYMGVVIALIAQAIFNTSEPGVMIGSIAGIISAMTDPLVGLIFMLAIVPFKLIVLVVPGIIGASLGNKVIAKLVPAKP